MGIKVVRSNENWITVVIFSTPLYECEVSSLVLPGYANKMKGQSIADEKIEQINKCIFEKYN